MTGDRILLEGLEFHGHHGVFAEEARDGQRFVIDLALQVDCRRAGETDALADTVDYGQLYLGIKAIVEGPPFKLIEALAEAIAQCALNDARVNEVRVKVRKPQAPLPGPFDYVAVVIERARKA